jgi:[acyl-carrier-protein] S-malonyltransferase
MRAFIFPGQGSQAVGMGAALAEASRAARDVLGEVDEALKQKLSRLMADGPIEELTLTENAQPAIMANAIATLRASGIDLASKADFVAGHSLGEYSALCAAGTFDLATSARLLKKRGQAMQAAVPVGEGAMAALLGADLATAQAVAEAAAQGEICTVANDNDPSQVVISGHKGAVERALEIAREKGAKRAILDAARRRRHGRGAGGRGDGAARGLALRQRHRRAGRQSRRHPRAARPAGDRDGPLA